VLQDERSQVLTTTGLIIAVRCPSFYQYRNSFL